ncbi:hypothetical protein KKB40_00700 [Patescibacteria group bacterium]|nr:hypothetical protein [Patescibacteria group bacterium]
MTEKTPATKLNWLQSSFFPFFGGWRIIRDNPPELSGVNPQDTLENQSGDEIAQTSTADTPDLCPTPTNNH